MSQGTGGSYSRHRGIGLAALDVRHQAARRKQETARADLVKGLNEEYVLRARIDNDERLERCARERELLQYQEDKKKVLALKEERLARELELARREAEEKRRQKEDAEAAAKIREQKIVQKICAASSELRTLKQKLSCAQMNAERARQIAAARLERQILDAKEAAYAAEQAHALEKAAEVERMAALQAAERSEAYKQQLESQLLELEDKRRIELEEFEREKAIVDATVARIIAEDEAARAESHRKRSEAKRFIAEHEEKRLAHKKAEEEALAAEEEAIRKYLETVNDRTNTITKVRNSSDTQREAVYKQIAEQSAAEAAAKLEAESLRIELAQAEEEEKQAEKARKEHQRRLKLRLELIEAHAQQIAHRQAKRLAEHETEEEFRRRVSEQLEKQARLELLGQEHRRRKQMELRREIEQQVKSRQERELQDRISEETDRKNAEALERYRIAIVERERKRLLLENAKQLAGASVLPKGILRNEEDLALIREGVSKGEVKYSRDIEEAKDKLSRLQI